MFKYNTLIRVLFIFLDTFTLDNKTGKIRIKQQPSVGTNFLEFTVIISDTAGLTTDIRVQVYLSCKYIDVM